MKAGWGSGCAVVAAWAAVQAQQPVITGLEKEPDGTVKLSFEAVEGKLLAVESASDLAGPWEPLLGQLAVSPDGTGMEFYRIRQSELSEGFQPSPWWWQREYALRNGLPVEVISTIGMEFRLIPPGSFTMGSPASELGHDGEESPQHRVTIGYPLWVGKYEVTQGQWEAVMGSNPSWLPGPDDRPVEMVSWDECQTFIETLNGLPEGGGYRLLSEAEWEYACRAGTSTAFHGGQITEEGGLDPVLDGLGWFWNNSSGATHQVGQKRANAWGLHDMHGNVWEWVEDDWHESYCLWWSGRVCVRPAPFDGSAWADEPRGSSRVRRGGSWGYDAGRCRSAYRLRLDPVDRYGSLGFRLARQLPGASAQ